MKAAGKKPITLITDELPARHDVTKESYTLCRETRTEHVRHTTLRRDHDNSKMERMNGRSQRPRKDVERLEDERYGGTLRMPTLLQLQTTTPSPKRQNTAEACGLIIEGENKWITLIQNAIDPTKDDGQTSSNDKLVESFCR